MKTSILVVPAKVIMRLLRILATISSCLLVLTLFAGTVVRAAGGELELRAVDQDTGKPIAIRVHLKDQRGRPFLPRKEVCWKDHFVFQHKAILTLPVGTYTFEAERGPEYRITTGYFTIDKGATDTKVIQMRRFATLKKEGWWSGDLNIHRSPEDIELLMAAEDLHFAPVTTWWRKVNPWLDKPLPEPAWKSFATDRYYFLLGGKDHRKGGALTYLNFPRPMLLADAQPEFPSSAEFLVAKRSIDNAFVDIEKPYWWDMPVWIASQMCDSVGLLNDHLQRDRVATDGKEWKSRDKFLYPGPLGKARWSQAIYFKLLNAGVHLPPSAGSGSGIVSNPVGYNRVYVHCGEEVTPEKWLAGLRAGRVVVTNGPLIRNPRANNQLPGHVFAGTEGESVELSLSLNLSVREKVEYLEVIRDGEVIHEVRLADWAKAGGKLPLVTFDKSGWCLVRAVTNNTKTYRYAMTAPFYVQIGGAPRVSRESAQFFLDWVEERARQINIADANQRERVIKYHRAARDFWQRRVEQANAD